jgi:hypothetical protein
MKMSQEGGFETLGKDVLSLITTHLSMNDLLQLASADSYVWNLYQNNAFRRTLFQSRLVLEELYTDCFSQHMVRGWVSSYLDTKGANGDLSPIVVCARYNLHDMIEQITAFTTLNTIYFLRRFTPPLPTPHVAKKYVRYEGPSAHHKRPISAVSK